MDNNYRSSGEYVPPGTYGRSNPMSIPMPAGGHRKERPLARSLSTSQSPLSNYSLGSTPVLDDYEGSLSQSPSVKSITPNDRKLVSPVPQLSESVLKATLEELSQWKIEVREHPPLFSEEAPKEDGKIVINDYSEGLAKIGIELFNLVYMILEHPGNRRILEKHMGDTVFTRELFPLLNKGSLKALIRPLAKVVQSPIAPEIAEIVEGRKVRYNEIISATDIDEGTKQKLIHEGEQYWRGADLYRCEMVFSGIIAGLQQNEEACKRIICAKQILFEKNLSAMALATNENLDVIRKAVEIVNIKLKQLFDDVDRNNAPIERHKVRSILQKRALPPGTVGGSIEASFGLLSKSLSAEDKKRELIDKMLTGMKIPPDELSRFAGKDLYEFLVPAGIDLVQSVLKTITVKFMTYLDFSQVVTALSTTAYEVTRRMFMARNEGKRQFTVLMLKRLNDTRDKYGLHGCVLPHDYSVENPQEEDRNYFLHHLLPGIKRLVGSDSLALLFIREHMPNLERLLKDSVLLAGIEGRIEKSLSDMWLETIHSWTDPLSLNKKIIDFIEGAFKKKLDEQKDRQLTDRDYWLRYSNFTEKMKEIDPETDPVFFKRASVALARLPDLFFDVGFGVNGRLADSLIQLLHLFQFPPFSKNLLYHLCDALFVALSEINPQKKDQEAEYRYLNSKIYNEKLPEPESPFSEEAMKSLLNLITLLLQEGLSGSSKKGAFNKTVNVVAGGVLNFTSIVDNQIKSKLKASLGEYGPITFAGFMPGLVKLIFEPPIVTQQTK